MGKKLEGAEIFDVGTWNGLSFTSEALDGIVSAFDALDLSGKVPLKFGHDGGDVRADDTQPALGWVSRIYRQGSKLLADFVDVPTEVFDAIKAGLYKFVSVELLMDVMAGTRKIPWVLDAVALLGATAPAVGTLKDLQALTYAHTGLRYGAVRTFARDSFIHSRGDDKHMADDTNAIKTLTDQVASMSRELAAIQSENRDLRQTVADGETLKRRFGDLEKRIRTERIDAHRAMIKDKLDAAVSSKDITPGSRERFLRRFEVETAVDEALFKITAEDVAEFIKENPNADKPKPRTRVLMSKITDPYDDNVPDGTPPDAELASRAIAFCRKNSQPLTAENIKNAAKTIVGDIPELAQSYKQYAIDVHAGNV